MMSARSRRGRSRHKTTGSRCVGQIRSAGFYRLIGPCIDFPVVDFLLQIDAKAFKGIRGIAPFVSADQSPVERLVSHAPRPEFQRTLLPTRIFAQSSLKFSSPYA